MDPDVVASGNGTNGRTPRSVARVRNRTSTSDCAVCHGPLFLRYRGSDAPPSAATLAPSRHRPGEHGDLYACRRCGTVQQPSLPGASALHALYRAMDDGDYLAEEAGRRRTAARLLDLIGQHVPRGRLLDVGCGHGVLLAEARARGYDVLGLELAAGAVRHAREELGLPVLDVPLEEFRPQADAAFDVVVLADVLEHVDDPVEALDACCDLLTDGGVLCVVTPDPASAAARLAGRRWWGYLPAHRCLLPRRTVLELLAARGLVISTDVPLVRSFTAGRWVTGLAERAGPLAGPLARLAAHERLTGELSLSLGDECVVLAHRLRPQVPERVRIRDRGAARKVHVVLPAYNAELTVAQVADGLDPAVADRALLVDDASCDQTVAVALTAGLEVLRHPANRGYGANQKTSYVRALQSGADVIVMVHADNQYDPELVGEMARPILEGRAEVVMGSRLLEDRAVAGGMPLWKWVGNRALTWAENRAFGARFSEYHTGYRAFSADALRRVAFLRNDDGFVFDQEIVAQLLARGARVVEIPIPTRYFHEASSVSFRSSVAYGLRTLRVLVRFRNHVRGRWANLEEPIGSLRPHDERIARAAARRQRGAA
ncbi:MAG TPA: methyltransferase domain-containing protein [Solirubrobacteraceae bacterium]|nr:methyltransferase domain-containing protein [Solirubrobacteraceae bacterium]